MTLSAFELARNWRAQNAAKVELRQFTPEALLPGVDELAQSHSTEAELAHELARNWRNWRSGVLTILAITLQPISNRYILAPFNPPTTIASPAGAA